MNRHERSWRAAARQHGFIPAQRTGKGHLRFQNPETGAVVTCSGTPSDVFAKRKFVADMRRANRNHTAMSGTVGCDPPPAPPQHQFQTPQAVPSGWPAAFPTEGTTSMPNVTELTIRSLRAYAVTLATQRSVPHAATLRRSVINVLDASSYLDTDRLIDLDLGELESMLATTRPDLTHNSRRTYIGQLKRVAQMLIDQTAAHHGIAPPILARQASPATVRQAKRGADTATRNDTAPSAPCVPATPAHMLTIPFPLRPELTITLALPADLTDGEAERLTQMIKLLPVNSR